MKNFFITAFEMAYPNPDRKEPLVIKPSDWVALAILALLLATVIGFCT